MRIRLTAAVIAGLLFFSCSREERIPGDILSKNEMTAVMYDMLLAESYAESYMFKDTSVKKDMILHSQADKVLAIHKVSQETFRKSFDYYKSHPGLFKVIIDTLNGRAVRNKDRIYDPVRKKVLE